MKRKISLAIIVVLAAVLAFGGLLLAACSNTNPEGKTYSFSRVISVKGEYTDADVEDMFYDLELSFNGGEIYFEDESLGKYVLDGDTFVVDTGGYDEFKVSGTVSGSSVMLEWTDEYGSFRAMFTLKQTSSSEGATLDGRVFTFIDVMGVTGEFEGEENSIREENYRTAINFDEGRIYIDGEDFGPYTYSKGSFSVVEDDGISGTVNGSSMNVVLGGEREGYALLRYEEGTPEEVLPMPTITAENAATLTQEMWAELDDKSASTTIILNDFTFAIAGGDMSFTTGLRLALDRNWSNGVMTMDVTAQLQNPQLDLGQLPVLGSILSSFIDIDELDNLVFEFQIFYEYENPDRIIGIKDIYITGLKSAIPGIVDPDITDAPWHIMFDVDGDGEKENKVSTSLTALNEELTIGTAGSIISKLFNEGYVPDLTTVVDHVLLNQTMLNFGDTANAEYDNGTYTNRVDALDNIGFIMDIWNELTTEGKEMVKFLLVGEKGVDDAIELPVVGIRDVYFNLEVILEAIIPNPDNLLPSLIDNIVTGGEMNVNATVNRNLGIFSALSASISGGRIDLNQDHVNAIGQAISEMFYDMDGILSPGMAIYQLIDLFCDGEAWFDLGTLKVNTTYSA